MLTPLESTLFVSDLALSAVVCAAAAAALAVAALVNAVLALPLAVLAVPFVQNRSFSQSVTDGTPNFVKAAVKFANA